MTFWIYVIGMFLVFKYVEWEPDPNEEEMSEEDILRIREEYEE